jgi:hypothetical protein
VIRSEEMDLPEQPTRKEPVCWWVPLLVLDIRAEIVSFARWSERKAWPAVRLRFWRVVPHRLQPLLIVSRMDKYARCGRCERVFPYQWPPLPPVLLDSKEIASFMLAMNSVGKMLSELSGQARHRD